MLVQRGYEVVVLDDLSRGSPEAIPREARLLVMDIRDRKATYKALNGVDYVIHLAAVVSVDEARQDPWRACEVNVKGTLNLLNASLKAEVNRFVYASSCAVYGDPDELPIREDFPLKPINTYGATKAAGEALVRAYTAEHGLSAVALRYFNVYGPGMSGGPYAGVVHKFITAALQGKPLTIYGDGEQTRDFIYVEDVAEANVKALESEVSGVYNIGSGVSVTINELAHLILEATNSKSIIKHEAPRPGDVRKSQADIDLSRRHIGWEPRTSLQEGIAKTVASFRERAK